MSHRLSCYTLFDITRTGVLNRARPNNPNDNIEDWVYKRNTQCNFDTILQVISLRSQPEVLVEPKKIALPTSNKFGQIYQNEKTICWTFDFEVQHNSVFENGIQELGALYTDCQGVPMLLCKTEHNNLPNYLDINTPTQNIYFVKY